MAFQRPELCDLCKNKANGELARPDSCKRHWFHKDCLIDYSRRVTKCPIDRNDYRLIVCEDGRQIHVIKKFNTFFNSSARGQCFLCDKVLDNEMVRPDACKKHWFHRKCLTTYSQRLTKCPIDLVNFRQMVFEDGRKIDVIPQATPGTGPTPNVPPPSYLSLCSWSPVSNVVPLSSHPQSPTYPTVPTNFNPQSSTSNMVSPDSYPKKDKLQSSVCPAVPTKAYPQTTSNPTVLPGSYPRASVYPTVIPGTYPQPPVHKNLPGTYPQPPVHQNVPLVSYPEPPVYPTVPPDTYPDLPVYPTVLPGAYSQPLVHQTGPQVSYPELPVHSNAPSIPYPRSPANPNKAPESNAQSPTDVSKLIGAFNELWSAPPAFKKY